METLLRSRRRAGRSPGESLRLDRPRAALRRAQLRPAARRAGHGDGCWVWDDDGRRYLDLMSAYSAVSFGHAHPRIVRRAGRAGAAARRHVARVPQRPAAGVPRSDWREVTGLDRALPTNGGAEAVETALKAARKWGYKVKGIPAERAEIIVCEGNFHGRSIAIVGFSSEPQYRDGFGPFPPGFRQIPFGDAAALDARDHAAHRRVPGRADPGRGRHHRAARRLPRRCARICRERNVLLICDEIQTGLGRTGNFLACEHDGVRPDGVILGKALGGGMLPVSAFVAHRRA